MPDGSRVPSPEDGQDRASEIGRRREAPIAVEILGEREIPQAWEYDAQVLTGSGSLERSVLVLSWADYQLWSPDGAIPPSRVAEAVLLFLARHREAFAGLERIDAAIARRKVRGADAAIADILHDS
ncbi:MAG: hypothetical protein JNL80_04525 [Phycisphaerae bacterium]|jgi:hypothetical protein|nr:hypothetical protein [Phycisphaerae bacterium]